MICHLIHSVPCRKLLNHRELNRDWQDILQCRSLLCPGETSLLERSVCTQADSPPLLPVVSYRAMLVCKCANAVHPCLASTFTVSCNILWLMYIACHTLCSILVSLPSVQLQSTTPEWIFGPKCQQGPITIPDTSATWTCGIQVTGRYACSGGQLHAIGLPYCVSSVHNMP